MITLKQTGSYKGKDYVVYEMTCGKYRALVTNIGCAIMQLHVPDQNGNLADVVLGYDTVEAYIDTPKYFGAVIGRVGNRIKNSCFEIDGAHYEVTPTHPGKTSLHGGIYGFDTKAFACTVGTYNGREALHFYYTSPDGEEGYPGNLTLQVTYWLSEDGDFGLHYTATTDKATMCNITNHSFFNLRGHDGGSIEGHELWLDCDYYTPTDEGQNATGEIAAVKGTALDFSTPTAIGARIDDEIAILRYGKGYDLNYVVNVRNPGEIIKMAEVYEPETGRVMEVFTNAPGVQLYSGNNIADVPGKNGAIYRKRDAVCLETQNFPGCTQKMHFPSAILRPGQVYDFTTVYRFSTK